MYEYQKELTQIHSKSVSCPPANAVGQDVDAWRWVRNPISEKCFLPVAVKNPPRFHSTSGPSERCACWGLSMHSTKAKAIKAFSSLLKSVPNARKLFGDHVARATLTSVHGVYTPPTSNGHFTAHPLKGVQLHLHFEIAEKLP